MSEYLSAGTALFAPASRARSEAATAPDTAEQVMAEHYQLYGPKWFAAGTAGPASNYADDAGWPVLANPVGIHLLRAPRLVADWLRMSATRGVTRSAQLAIELCIRDSRAITELADDWDGEGSEGYRVETWERATSFLRAMAWSPIMLASSRIMCPTIGPADRGSIDLYWNAPRGQLLINIPAIPAALPTYSWLGENGENEYGVVDTHETALRLITWLQTLSS